MRDARSAAGFVRERGLVMATGRSSLPVLAEAIAGRQLRGSWMAHPEAGRIYSILLRLDQYRMFSAPVILGKQTLIAPALGPAVQRVAADPARREHVMGRLPRLARRLLERIDGEGSLRMDRLDLPGKDARAARLLLERELLVASRDVHTERGYHTSIVSPWAASPLARRVSNAASRLTYEEAADRLVLAAVRSAVIAPEREAKRWFVFGPERLEVLVARGQVMRHTSRGQVWLSITGGTGWVSPSIRRAGRVAM